MKNKKLLSTILAATLTATTMAMPVMATERGSVEIDVGMATDVIRVEVPTTLAVQIDQYQLEQDAASGDCQIYSEEFSILNKGNIHVKVDVTSSVSGDVKDSNKLATTKKGAKDSKSGDAWLAAAAVTGLNIDASGDAGSYDYDDTTTTSGETYATLTETNKNVATFNASGDAKQTFYLEKASGDVVYKKVTKATSGDVAPYAKYREMTSVTGTASGDPAILEEAKNQDVYVVYSGDATMRRVRKGATTYTAPAGKVYNPASGDALYKIAPGNVDSLEATKVYMYGEGNVRTTGASAFRYIGALAKGQTWTTSDIDQITINYTIEGIDPSEYTEASANCVQGLYKDEGANAVNVAAASVASGTASIRLVTGQNAVANKITSVKVDGTATTHFSVSSSGAIAVTGITGSGAHTILIVYDGTTYKASVTI